MGVEIKVLPKLEVLSRLKVLHYVVHELAHGFGVDEYSLETIRKGILDRQVLAEIIINYLNADGKLVGRVTISIDWAKHRALAKSDSGKSFELDTNKSINEQISRLYPLLVEHTEELRKAFDVKKIEVRYRYTREVWADEKRLKEVRQFLNTSPAEELVWAENPKSNAPGWDVEFEVITRKLEELRIKIEHNKPK